ncbi:MAG TPA: hypothetical protein VIZ28_05975 [Chitinophagaceae bacterium]
MKRMILTVVFVTAFAVGKMFAAGEEIASRQAKETFKKEFPDAGFPKWEKIENSSICAVRFVYDNQSFIAYFNEQGEMIAAARLISRESLPYKVSQVVRKMYNDPEITKIEELTMEGTVSYFFTIDNEGTRIFLRVYHDGTMQKIKEEKKEVIGSEGKNRK